MRFYLPLFVAIGILFQSQAQTKNPATTIPGPLKNMNTLEQAEDKMDEENIPDSMRVYTYAAISPSFPGGDTAFSSFIKKNLIYPEDAKSNHIVGTVFVKFIIEKDGSLSSICVIPGKGISPSCDQAAIDVVSKSPKWTPGKMNDKTVRVLSVRRVKFELY